MSALLFVAVAERRAALGKDDVQLSVQCATSVVALYDEYSNKVEVSAALTRAQRISHTQRFKEVAEAFDLVFDLRDLSVSVDHLLRPSTESEQASSCVAPPHAACNAEAQLLLQSYFLTNRRVRGTSV